MASQSCWNSLSCLEDWQRWLQLSLIVGGLAGGLVGVGLFWISNRIDSLKADRTFTLEQEQAIANSLRGKLPTCFIIKTYAPSADSSEYGSKLEKMLIHAGWDSRASEAFHTRGGEELPTGITIMVDGIDHETKNIGQNLETALKAAHVEDVKFVIEKDLPDLIASTWVLIKIGRKANQ